MARKFTHLRGRSCLKKALGQKPSENYHNSKWVSRDFTFIYAWLEVSCISKSVREPHGGFIPALAALTLVPEPII